MILSQHIIPFLNYRNNETIWIFPSPEKITRWLFVLLCVQSERITLFLACFCFPTAKICRSRALLFFKRLFFSSRRQFNKLNQHKARVQPRSSARRVRIINVKFFVCFCFWFTFESKWVIILFFSCWFPKRQLLCSIQEFDILVLFLICLLFIFPPLHLFADWFQPPKNQKEVSGRRPAVFTVGPE